jgi:hypothetical protein
VTKVANGCDAAFQVFASQLCAHQNAFGWGLHNSEEHPGSKLAIEVACDLGFRRDNHIKKQMCVAVDQTGQQGGAPQIDGLHARCMRLHLRRRTNLFDLAVFNQDSRRRKHIPGSRVKQMASFY